VLAGRARTARGAGGPRRSSSSRFSRTTSSSSPGSRSTSCLRSTA
jgi:hypothetical protein